MCLATIDSDAIRENARVLVQAAGGLPVLADVSADGHGHGAVQAAAAALRGGASWLAVSTIADAAALREAGIRGPVVASFSRPGDTQDAAALEVTVRGFHRGVPRLFEPGAALYGLGADAMKLGLAPTMRVTARVLITKEIAEGDGVSYGYTYRAAASTKLAMVAIGYADGLDRAAGNVATMLLAGNQRAVVGRVAMNAAVLNMGEDAVAVGEEAVLFGGAGEPSVHSWAAAIGVPEDEVVTVFGRSLARSYR